MMATVSSFRTTLADQINGLTRKVPVWCVYVAGLLPVPWLLYQAQTGGLGREPISALEHELGLLALQLIIAGLAVSPLRRFVGVNLMKFRRAVGVLAFVYVALHLLVWLVLDIGIVSQIWADIIKRPYITIGMISFLFMIPLAATSNNRAVKSLGASWRRLHFLVYPAAILAVIHYIMVQKVWELEPLLYLLAILGLLALRIPKSVLQRNS
ncbi:MAG: protein-methionine-sulfoxide reductase heme-binding subunit MsrQ [Pseudomonadota bacterium]